MPVKMRFDPINIDVEVEIEKSLAPAAQSAAFAQIARGFIEEAKAQNQKALGRVPQFSTAVDGRVGAPLESAIPGSVVFTEFELVIDVLDWIGQMLREYSPVKSGRYRDSHVLVADGIAVDPDAPPPVANEYTFVNVQPYARKIERGLSPKRPDGVYQAVAQLAKSKFSNVARIKYGYATPLFGAIDEWANSPAGARWAQLKSRRRKELHAEWLRRQPSIIVTL